MTQSKLRGNTRLLNLTCEIRAVLSAVYCGARLYIRQVSSPCVAHSASNHVRNSVRA